MLLICCSKEEITSPNLKTAIAPFAGFPDEQLLQIPTYDGSGQATHPDIIYFPQKHNGFHFYMTLTPYPYSNDHFENVSIYVSNNGIDFQEQMNGLNPLVSPAITDHNDDPDILFTGDEFRIYYLETRRPYFQNLNILESQDGIHWTNQTAIHYDLGAGDKFIVSPSVIKYENGYRMYYVNLSRTGNPIEYLMSDDGLSWSQYSSKTITVDYPGNLVPWHIDVFEGNGQYYMLCCGPHSNLNLYLATSNDMDHWIFKETPILSHSTNFYNSDYIYRSTGLVDGDLLVIWFSIRTVGGRWGIGVKKYSLQKLFQ